MDNEQLSLDELIVALVDWQNRWASRIQEATTQSQQVSVQSVHQSYYYRGVAEGLKVALRDLQTVLPASNETQNVEAAPQVEPFAPVDQETAAAVLKSAGLSVAELQRHSDNSFSAIFSALQLTRLEERITKLSAVADIVVLAQGRLPNSNKSYIDFAFRNTPQL
jgi:hypothetical protein